MFQDQRQNFKQALHYFQDGWDHFRLKPSENLTDPRLKKFTLLVGRKLMESLKENAQQDKAASILVEYEQIDAIPDVETLRKDVR